MAFHLFFHIARAKFDIFPKKDDGVKSLKIIKAMLFGGVEPKSEKYLPEQRLAYFFIGLVLLLLIITGLIKTAKNLVGWNLSEGLYLRR
ncbi:cytochrome b/b6 domain-containing protein [Campylobacter upsaliensis]